MGHDAPVRRRCNPLVYSTVESMGITLGRGALAGGAIGAFGGGLFGAVAEDVCGDGTDAFCGGAEGGCRSSNREFRMSSALAVELGVASKTGGCVEAGVPGQPKLRGSGVDLVSVPAW